MRSVHHRDTTSELRIRCGSSYITTRGMDIATGDPLEQATPHLKALSWLWGIGPMDVIATQNMDYVSLDEIEEKVQNAIKEGLKLVEEW